MKHKFVKKIEGFLLIMSAILIGGSAYLIGNMNTLESNLSEIKIVYPDNIAVKEDVQIEEPQSQKTTTQSNDIKSDSVTGKIVASKNGKRYYYPNCGGINRIKLENRIYFDTNEQAESKGLTLASGCKAL